MKLPGSGYTTSHPDFHLPDSVEVGKNFDIRKYVETLKNAEVDVVYFFAKCHYGNSYYFTTVGHRHPGLKRDLLQEIVSGCHKENIRVIAYFSGGIDTYAAKQHSDWLPVGKDRILTEIPKDANKLVHVCLAGPYVDEWLVPQMAEVAQMYEVDGIMTDVMSSFSCYCKNCQRQYLKDTGKPIPLDEDNKEQSEFCKWRYRKKEEFIDKICKGVHKVKANLPVAFNWMYSIRDPAPINKEIGYLVGDIPQVFEQLPLFSLTARYFASTGLPFEVMTGRFLHGLGDWSIKPVDMMKQGMVTVAANGGRCTLIDRQLPDGNLDKTYYEKLKQVFHFIHERKAAFEGATVVKQIGILNSALTKFGVDKELYVPNQLRDKQVEGAAMVITDLSKHSTITNEGYLEKDLDKYETIVLPEQKVLPDSTIKQIKQYVENGGTVIASHRTGFEKNKWLFSDMFGLKFEEEYSYDFCYIKSMPNGKNEYANVPVMIHGICAKLKTNGCQVLSYLHEPMIKERFGWGEAPPREEPSSPSITLHHYGKGKAVYIAGPVFTSFCDFYNPGILFLVKNVFDILVPEPLLDVQCEPGVEVTLTSQDNRININLINTNGERRNKTWSVTESIRPTGEIQIRFRMIKKPGSVTLIPENKPVPFSYENNVVTCKIPHLHIHTCVQIQQ